MACPRGTLRPAPTEPEYIPHDAYQLADNVPPAESLEPEQSMESEGEDPQEEQTTEDQEKEPLQQEPCGPNRRSLKERKPAQRMTYPYLGQPAFQTLPNLHTIAANTIPSRPLIPTSAHTWVGHISNPYEVVPVTVVFPMY